MTTAPSKIELSPDQRQAHDTVVAWVMDGSSSVLTLGGYAGAGKSTVIAEIAKTLRTKKKGLRIGFCAFTGKAALVMQRKLQAADALGADYCGTIHGLIYRPKLEDGKVVGWELRGRAELFADLFVIDEASMVDEKLFEDLKSYGLPILAVGDHGQLPPVAGSLNLMKEPMIRLEQIHRQAEDNPIIKLSMMARLEGYIPPGKYGPYVSKVTDQGALSRVPTESLDPRDTMVICGINRTRTALNQVIRTRLGYKDPDPQAGERVICLKNDRQRDLFNGLTGFIQKIKPYRADHYEATIKLDTGTDFEGLVSRAQFGAAKTLEKVEGLMPYAIGARFDWGYAVTCHKAQGSEARRVVVYEECDWMESDDLRRRWIYTAVTRARERLLIIGR